MTSSSKDEATSSNSSSDTRRKYDVFLSFRGDTRHGFTDHLYTALCRDGLITFIDTKDIARGKVITGQLEGAIEESMFSIIVISKDYASSTWCLDELVKILECMKQRDQRVWPVFYHVDPSEARKQKGEFGLAFAKHEKRFRDNLEKVHNWREALTEVANISGWHLDIDRSESKFIDGIVRYISNELKRTRSSPKKLVGIESRFAELSSYLQVGTKAVLMIGISGMGGLGKTTIAEETYLRLSSNFEGSSFVGKVRERSKNSGLASIQTQILCDTLRDPNILVRSDYDGANELRSRLCCKRVLIVLDDVDQSEQLERLAGSCDWFGPGSRIIIVSRDEHLLLSHGVKDIYKGKELNREEAHQLFVSKAFHGRCPEAYKQLSERALNFASGLPLAVDVIGKHLCGRSEHVWKDAINRMEKNLGKDILGVLRISYDGLEESEKNIFLDIAFFFKSMEEVYAEQFLDNFGFNARIGIRVLEEKSLITISNDRIEMHDLLQKLGWHIVHEICPNEPGKRSRLLDQQDVDQVLRNNKGTKTIEGICRYSRERELPVSAQAFTEMEQLRYLDIQSHAQLQDGLAYLPNELRFIRWNGYPLKFFPSSFEPRKLFALHLKNSNIQTLFHGVQSLEELKHLDMSFSQQLINIPNLESMPNLEVLILSGCNALTEICSYHLVHKRLAVMDLKGCSSLGVLATKITLESLRSLDLTDCLMLTEFPEVVGVMKKLTRLSLRKTAIRELPPNMMSCFTGLEFLDLRYCESLVKLNFEEFTYPMTLILRGCRNLEGTFPLVLQQRTLVDVRNPAEVMENMESNAAVRELPPGVGIPSSRMTWTFPLREIRSRLPLLTTANWGNQQQPDPRQLVFLSLVQNLKRSSLPERRAVPPPLGGGGGVTSLEELRLMVTESTTQPEIINHLPDLVRLDLNNYIKFLSLQKLPPTLSGIKFKAAPEEGFCDSSLFDCSLSLDFLNCFKIAERPRHGTSPEFKILQDYIRLTAKLSQHHRRKHVFETVLPRNGLPKWFQYQSMSSSVRAEIPPDFHASDIQCVVVVAVFCSLSPNVSYNAPKRIGYKPYNHVGSSKSSCLPGVHLCLSTRVEQRKFTLMTVEGHDDIVASESDHLWMWCCFIDLNRCSSLEVEFLDFPSLRVRMCGVHLIYGEDIDDALRLLNQPDNEDEVDNVMEPSEDSESLTKEGIE